MVLELLVYGQYLSIEKVECILRPRGKRYKKLEKGGVPSYVNVTASTTVLCAYDPLNEIADVCQTHKLWMDIDASLGGSIVFSNQQRHKLEGTKRADSITIDPHKMMGVLTYSLFFSSRGRYAKTPHRKHP